MKKKTNTKTAINNELASLSRDELHVRRLANVAERKRLSDENKLIVQLWKEAAKKTVEKPTAKAAKEKKQNKAKGGESK